MKNPLFIFLIIILVIFLLYSFMKNSSTTSFLPFNSNNTSGTAFNLTKLFSNSGNSAPFTEQNAEDYGFDQNGNLL